MGRGIEYNIIPISLLPPCPPPKGPMGRIIEYNFCVLIINSPTSPASFSHSVTGFNKISFYYNNPRALKRRGCSVVIISLASFSKGVAEGRPSAE
jgi:hypothetical protein